MNIKPVNQKAWLLILPVVICVAFSAILPLMTVVNYSVQDIIDPERRVFVGTEWFKAVMRDDDLQGALLRQIPRLPAALLDLVVGRAEGNPFYLEELITMLIEDGVIIADGAEWRVAPERLVFAPAAQPRDHLARQARADLFLDTLPCTAHTTQPKNRPAPRLVESARRSSPR